MAAGIASTSLRLAATHLLADDVSRLKYVSGTREEALRRLGIERVGDLLLHVPRRYLDFTHALTIEAAPLGEVATIVAVVDRVTLKRPRPRLTVVEVSLVDETGVLEAAFFKQPWLAQQLAPGDRLALIGKVEFSYGFKRMTAPHFEKLDGDALAGSMVPVHPVGEGISVAWMRRIVAGALERTTVTCDPRARRAQGAPGAHERGAGSSRHPLSQRRAERGAARSRLAYDELLFLQLALRLRNRDGLLGVTPVAHTPASHVARLRAALPFALSDEQERACEEILADMADGSRVMNRLLLGDVGTGKTAVACVALAAVADTGTQAAVMAPTGVLAQQYAQKCGPLLDAAGISWTLITGSTPASSAPPEPGGFARGR